jgi:hypothetical protein
MPKTEGTFKPPCLRVSRIKTPKDPNPSQSKTFAKETLRSKLTEL